MEIKTLNRVNAQIAKHIRISKKNIKMGKVPNISLPPGRSCMPKAPCRTKCYANKAWRQYGDTRKSWSRNFRTYRRDPELYFSLLDNWIRNSEPALFRFHVAGDIPDERYLDGMIEVAKRNQKTRFLVFTKRYSFFRGKRMPMNLSVVFSAWPGLPLPRQKRFPIAFMQNGTEDRVKNAIKCSKSCETCAMCWELKGLGKNVVFYKH